MRKHDRDEIIFKEKDKKKACPNLGGLTIHVIAVAAAGIRKERIIKATLVEQRRRRRRRPRARRRRKKGCKIKVNFERIKSSCNSGKVKLKSVPKAGRQAGE